LPRFNLTLETMVPRETMLSYVKNNTPHCSLLTITNQLLVFGKPMSWTTFF